MKIIIVGAVGAVGKTAVHGLSGRHEIICVGRTSGDVQMDIMDHADPELESHPVAAVDIFEGRLDAALEI